MSRHKNAVGENARGGMQFRHRGPILDVRDRCQVAGGVEVFAELLRGRPCPPAIRGVRNELPAKAEIARQFLRDPCFPVSRQTVAVTDDVANAEVTKRSADEPRIVSATQRHHDCPAWLLRTSRAKTLAWTCSMREMRSAVGAERKSPWRNA